MNGMPFEDLLRMFGVSSSTTAAIARPITPQDIEAIKAELDKIDEIKKSIHADFRAFMLKQGPFDPDRGALMLMPASYQEQLPPPFWPAFVKFSPYIDSVYLKGETA